MALDIAREDAAQTRVPLRTLESDLEAEPFPAGPWDLILSFHFLWRPLFDAYSATLAPDGLLIVSQPTRSNLQRFDRPGPRHLLDDGELPGLIGGLEILHYEEGWLDEGRHEARLVARRHGTGAG